MLKWPYSIFIRLQSYTDSSLIISWQETYSEKINSSDTHVSKIPSVSTMFLNLIRHSIPVQRILNTRQKGRRHMQPLKADIQPGTFKCARPQFSAHSLENADTSISIYVIYCISCTLCKNLGRSAWDKQAFANTFVMLKKMTKMPRFLSQSRAISTFQTSPPTIYFSNRHPNPLIQNQLVQSNFRRSPHVACPSSLAWRPFVCLSP